MPILDSTTRYSQGTVFPEGFDPVAAGLKFTPSAAGDLDTNEVLDVADIDGLTFSIHPIGHLDGQPLRLWLPDVLFDLNTEGKIDQSDHRTWVKDLRHTWFGDANLDGEFNTSDLVRVFVAGKYEQGWLDDEGNSHGQVAGWAEGDWNGDRFFDSSDLVTAFADGGYEQGMRPDAALVPEPCSALSVLLGMAALLLRRRRVR